MKILVTGGTGYIGSHTVVELINAGHTPIIVDNLSNSKLAVLDRIAAITGTKPEFHPLDLTDLGSLSDLFLKHKFDGVIHFAGLKAVGQSVKKPLLYYRQNLVSTLNLLDCLKEFSIKNLVFSSSATVYGQPASVPITEDFPLHPESPYGQTKSMIEQMLTDFQHAHPDTNIAILRYFNPVGAHPSGLIGEDPSGIPNNLMPYITQVATGKLPQLSIFGHDYPTPDGTGVRDYIHVVDLALGHLAALNRLSSHPGLAVYNLGSGHGHSVLEVVSAFESASGVKIPYQFADRRPGDIAECYADVSKANRELGWSTQKSLSAMCADAWRWQSKNPQGYNP